MNADLESGGGIYVIDAVFSIVRGTERRDVALASYLDGAGEERALTSAYGWIKRLRHANVDGSFAAAVYGSRRLAVVVCGTLPAQAASHPRSLQDLGALEALIDREHPRSVQLISGSRLVTRRGAGLHGFPL